jgi:hypothetical protein
MRRAAARLRRRREGAKATTVRARWWCGARGRGEAVTDEIEGGSLNRWRRARAWTRSRRSGSAPRRARRQSLLRGVSRCAPASGAAMPPAPTACLPAVPLTQRWNLGGWAQQRRACMGQRSAGSEAWHTSSTRGAGALSAPQGVVPSPACLHAHARRLRNLVSCCKQRCCRRPPVSAARYRRDDAQSACALQAAALFAARQRRRSSWAKGSRAAACLALLLQFVCAADLAPAAGGLPASAHLARCSLSQLGRISFAGRTRHAS